MYGISRIIFEVILGTFPLTVFVALLGAGLAGHYFGQSLGILCGGVALIGGGLLEGRLNGWDWADGRKVGLAGLGFVVVMGLVVLLVVP